MDEIDRDLLNVLMEIFQPEENMLPVIMNIICNCKRCRGELIKPREVTRERALY
jgi:hypothetical protein